MFSLLLTYTIDTNLHDVLFIRSTKMLNLHSGVHQCTTFFWYWFPNFVLIPWRIAIISNQLYKLKYIHILSIACPYICFCSGSLVKQFGGLGHLFTKELHHRSTMFRVQKPVRWFKVKAPVSKGLKRLDVMEKRRLIIFVWKIRALCILQCNCFCWSQKTLEGESSAVCLQQTKQKNICTQAEKEQSTRHSRMSAKKKRLSNTCHFNCCNLFCQLQTIQKSIFSTSWHVQQTPLCNLAAAALL